MIVRMRQRDRALACYERRKILPAISLDKFWSEMSPIMYELSLSRGRCLGGSNSDIIQQAENIYRQSARMVKSGTKMNEKRREVLAGKELARMKAVALEELGYIPTRKDS